MFHKISGIDKCFEKRGGGERGTMTTFCQKILSHSTESFRRGTVLCFTKFLVSTNVLKREGEWWRRFRDFL